MQSAAWSVATFLLAYCTAVGTVTLLAQVVPAELAVLGAYLAMVSVTCLVALRQGLPLRWSSLVARGFVVVGIFIATSLSYRLRWEAQEQWALATVLVTFPILLATMLIAWEVDRRHRQHR